ncbi:type I-E CRISPR-associated protein Cas5/CasD [bacterium]|nr:type I-E CRISPR-associated protein Cas5/CasD [bacterium]
MGVPTMPVLLLRLEGALQSWGLQSRHRVRDTALEPTRSGVTGLIACAMGRRRGEPLDDLRQLAMAVRVDRPGSVLRDYHTVGARRGIMSAQGKVKHTATTGEPETLLTWRDYLADASFLVALSGPPDVLDAVEHAVNHPVWTLFLGRKSCPPSVPVFAGRRDAADLLDALRSVPWRPRVSEIDQAPEYLRCVVECEATDAGAELRHDVPTSFAEPRRPEPRYVREVFIKTPEIGEPTQKPYRRHYPVRMNYRTRDWADRRHQRGEHDRFLCVFCGVPSIITHHITYRHVKNEDVKQELRSVCRRCHDAVTMLESERGFGLDRINPLDEKWRAHILDKRAQIDASRHTRRAPERKRR